MIEVANLTKKYGDNYAVQDLTFSVKKGEVLGFLGPNGAGKSTTMNILTGYISSTSGSAKVDGLDILEEPMLAKKKIGYLPEQPPLYLDMTVEEYLNFVYELKGVKIARKAHLAEICRLVKITDVYGRIIKHLSKGYRQRVGLAQALIGNPEVLILDEPTVGLDPKQIIEIRSLIKSLGKSHTVILSSHILSEVQATCERVVVINKGHLIADDTPHNLSQAFSTDKKIVVRIAGPEKDVLGALKSIENMDRVFSLGEKESGSYDFELEAKEDTDIRRGVFERMCERNWPILSMRSSEMTLEEIFLQLTREDSAGYTRKGGRK